MTVFHTFNLEYSYVIVYNYTNILNKSANVWPSYDHHTTIVWPLCDDHMIVIRWSYNGHTTYRMTIHDLSNESRTIIFRTFNLEYSYVIIYNHTTGLIKLYVIIYNRTTALNNSAIVRPSYDHHTTIVWPSCDGPTMVVRWLYDLLYDHPWSVKRSYDYHRIFNLEYSYVIVC